MRKNTSHSTCSSRSHSFAKIKNKEGVKETHFHILKKKKAFKESWILIQPMNNIKKCKIDSFLVWIIRLTNVRSGQALTTLTLKNKNPMDLNAIIMLGNLPLNGGVIHERLYLIGYRTNLCWPSHRTSFSVVRRERR